MVKANVVKRPQPTMHSPHVNRFVQPSPVAIVPPKMEYPSAERATTVASTIAAVPLEKVNADVSGRRSRSLSPQSHTSEVLPPAPKPDTSVTSSAVVTVSRPVETIPASRAELVANSEAATPRPPAKRRKTTPKHKTADKVARSRVAAPVTDSEPPKQAPHAARASKQRWKTTPGPVLWIATTEQSNDTVMFLTTRVDCAICEKSQSLVPVVVRTFEVGKFVTNASDNTTSPEIEQPIYEIIAIACGLDRTDVCLYLRRVVRGNDAAEIYCLHKEQHAADHSLIRTVCISTVQRSHFGKLVPFNLAPIAPYHVLDGWWAIPPAQSGKRAKRQKSKAQDDAGDAGNATAPDEPQPPPRKTDFGSQEQVQDNAFTVVSLGVQNVGALTREDYLRTHGVFKPIDPYFVPDNVLSACYGSGSAAIAPALRLSPVNHAQGYEPGKLSRVLHGISLAACEAAHMYQPQQKDQTAAETVPVAEGKEPRRLCGFQDYTPTHDAASTVVTTAPKRAIRELVNYSGAMTTSEETEPVAMDTTAPKTDDHPPPATKCVVDVIEKKEAAVEQPTVVAKDDAPSSVTAETNNPEAQPKKAAEDDNATRKPEGIIPMVIEPSLDRSAAAAPPAIPPTPCALATAQTSNTPAAPVVDVSAGAASSVKAPEDKADAVAYIVNHFSAWIARLRTKISTTPSLAKILLTMNMAQTVSFRLFYSLIAIYTKPTVKNNFKPGEIQFDVYTWLANNGYADYSKAESVIHTALKNFVEFYRGMTDYTADFAIVVPSIGCPVEPTIQRFKDICASAGVFTADSNIPK